MQWNSRRRTLAGCAGALALVALSAWAWNSRPFNLRDRIFPNHLAEVEPGWLYRSGQIAPNLIEGTLRDLGIDVVVDLSQDYGGRDAAQLAEKAAGARLGVEMLRFPLGGSGTGSIESYVGAVAAIERAKRSGQQVLVHCRAGDRRTGGVLAAYQMLVEGRSAEEARKEMDRFSRDPGAESRLSAFLDQNLDAIAQGLVEQRIIDRVPEHRASFASARSTIE